MFGVSQLGWWSTLSPLAIFVRCWAPENCPIGWIHTLNPWNWSPKLTVHISGPILAILGHKLQRQFWGLSTPFPTVFSSNHWHRLVKSFSDIFWCSKKLSKRKSYGQKRVFCAQIKHKLHKNGAFLPFPSIWHTFFRCTLACLSVLSMYNKNWGWISIGCAYPRKRSKHTPPQMWGPYPHIWWVSLNPKP